MFKKDINLNLYKIFYEVAKYKNFSKAAELTYSTQSAISKSIKKLESELGVELFYRKSNGVELTEKGKELLYYVEKSFGNLLTAERVLLETDELKMGRLSIGIPSNLYLLIKDSLLDFHKKYNNIEITIINGSTTYLLEQLDLHKIDFIIDTAPIYKTNDLTIETICKKEYCFIKKGKVDDIKSINDLTKYTLILPIPQTSNRDNLDELFVKHGISITNVLNVHTSEIIKELVKEDVGVGYLLYDFIKDDIDNKEISLVKVKEELPKVDIVIAYNKRFLTKAPRKFILEYIKNDMN